MSRSGIAVVVLTTFSAGLLIAAEQSRQTDERSRHEAVLTLPTPAMLAIWTDKPGCWGGLRILGRTPVTRLEGVAGGVLPPERPVYGGSDPADSSWSGVDFVDS